MDSDVIFVHDTEIAQNSVSKEYLSNDFITTMIYSSISTPPESKNHFFDWLMPK